jgi:hypothetical protein
VQSTRGYEVSLLSSRFGSPLPQLVIQLPHGSTYRMLNAELHLLAAAIELVTPVDERWTLHIEALYDARGSIYIQLFEGSEAEAARAMNVLKKAVG